LGRFGELPDEYLLHLRMQMRLRLLDEDEVHAWGRRFGTKGKDREQFRVDQ
jgi:hypothetical protein